MKKIKSIFVLSFLIFVLHSCGGGFKDARKVLTNEKITTTDEFLIKKRDPLTLPPDYDKLPEPGTNVRSNDQKKINDILKMEREKSNSGKNSLSLEKSILDKIRN